MDKDRNTRTQTNSAVGEASTASDGIISLPYEIIPVSETPAPMFIPTLSEIVTVGRFWRKRLASKQDRNWSRGFVAGRLAALAAIVGVKVLDHHDERSSSARGRFRDRRTPDEIKWAESAISRPPANEPNWSCMAEYDAFPARGIVLTLGELEVLVRAHWQHYDFVEVYQSSSIRELLLSDFYWDRISSLIEAIDETTGTTLTSKLILAEMRVETVRAKIAFVEDQERRRHDQ